MGSRTRYLIALALAAPVCAEIVNGSTSLSEIERPFATLFTLLPYSLLAIWLAFVASSNAPGNVLYLLPILGLVIEGLGTHSFFDSAFADLSTLAGIGVFAGVQWPWTLSLLASHAFAGFVVPLTLAAAIARPGSTAVTERTARIASITLVFILVLGWLVAPSTLSRHGIALTATLAVIALLILSAHKTRIPAPAAAVWAWPWFLVAGLAFVPLNWLTSLFLAQRIGAYAVLAQLLFLSAYLYFLWRAFFNPAASERRRMAFIAGYLVPHAIVLCLLGAIDIQRGIVGGLTAATVLFIALRYSRSTT